MRRILIILLCVGVQAGCQSAERWPDPIFAAPEPFKELLLPLQFQRDAQIVQVHHVIAKEKALPSDAVKLAELYYAAGDIAEKHHYAGSVDHFYFAAVYAFAAAFHEAEPDQARPRLRQLYNSALARCIQNGVREGRLDPKKELRIETPSGRIVVPIEHQLSAWQADDFDDLRLVGDYPTEAIAIRHRRDGFGVPVVALRHKRHDGEVKDRYCSPKHPFAVSAFLYADLASVDWQPGMRANARLVFHDPFRVEQVRAEGRLVPLADDLSAPLVVCLHQAQRLRLDYLGFRQPELADDMTGLFLLEPYQPGKIPVIFAHGLLSDPHTWDEMLNELRADPVINERFQFGLFFYGTGNPFLLSAGRLRRNLQEMVANLDPEGRDPAMRDMVLIGHSMGGLLTRLQVSKSGSKFWDLFGNRPVLDLNASAETKVTLLENFFFEPQPFIKRVVFIATPHRGSCLAHNVFGRLGSRLVERPHSLEASLRQLLKDNPGAFNPRVSGVLPTSLDDLASGSAMLKALADTEWDRGVKLHSIIGRGRIFPILEPGDGVVAVSSAHIEGVASELFVEAGHTSVHTHPFAVQEIKRILGEHLSSR